MGRKINCYPTDRKTDKVTYRVVSSGLIKSHLRSCARPIPPYMASKAPKVLLELGRHPNLKSKPAIDILFNDSAMFKAAERKEG